MWIYVAHCLHRKKDIYGLTNDVKINKIKMKPSLYFFFFERQLTHAHVQTQSRRGIRDPYGHPTSILIVILHELNI